MLPTVAGGCCSIETEKGRARQRFSPALRLGLPSITISVSRNNSEKRSLGSYRNRRYNFNGDPTTPPGTDSPTPVDPNATNSTPGSDGTGDRCKDMAGANMDTNTTSGTSDMEDCPK